MSENRKLLIYFDTNVLNFLCDYFKGRSKRQMKDFDIPLSWPLIDEIFCNNSYERTIELAKFAWQFSTRRVLLNVSDLVSLEVRSVIEKREISLMNYYDSGRSHLNALNEARNGNMPKQTPEVLRKSIAQQKERIRSWERIIAKSGLRSLLKVDFCHEIGLISGNSCIRKSTLTSFFMEWLRPMAYRVISHRKVL